LKVIPFYHKLTTDAKPSNETETQLFTEIQQKMKPTSHLLDQLKNYSGCGEQIRRAISSPSKQTEDEAWKAVSPAVGQLKEFFDFSFILGFYSDYSNYCLGIHSTNCCLSLVRYSFDLLLLIAC
jgi:hypothetical protein